MTRPNRFALPALVVAATAALALAGCGTRGDDAAPGSAASSSAATSPTPSPTDTRSDTQIAVDGIMAENEKNREEMDRQAAAAAANDPNSTETAELPDMVAMPLDDARAFADGVGFRIVIDEDALGQDRAQIGGDDWIVCSQDPGPGIERVEVLVTLSVVKKEETCP